jgi:hypothetical protein
MEVEMAKADSLKPALALAKEVADLVQAAMDFVPPKGGEALLRKWVRPGDVAVLSDYRQMCLMADTILLAGDLLLSQPSLTGGSAFSRMAKQFGRGHRKASEAGVQALLAARFRLLEVTKPVMGKILGVKDVLSGETLQLVWRDFPPLDVGTHLFGRMATVAQGTICPAGATTPLDAPALAVATGSGAAGAQGAMAQARWAEAVYTHVVRHGTLDVVGLNRPSAEFVASLDDGDTDDRFGFPLPMADLADEWHDLGHQTPGEDLLRRTRALADLPTLLDVLSCIPVTRAQKRADFAGAFERIALVLMETIHRREQAVAGGMGGGLTLDAVAAAIEHGIREHGRPAEIRGLFQAYRRRLVGSGPATRPEDAELQRLMQRIQALRAKTVAQGCTEQEALAAAEKVAELLDRYGLSLGELEFKAQPCEGVAIETNRKRMGPVDNCVPSIGAFFDCRVWAETGNGAPLRYIFFGLRADVAAAQYLYEMVERAFETETNRFRAGEIYASMEGERRSATNSFQIGMANGIRHKLHSLRMARDEHMRSASGRDLVPVKAAVVEDEMAKLGLALRTISNNKPKRVLSDAFAAGQEAGRRFEYAPGISAAA